MKSIKAWLEGEQNYDEGLILYHKIKRHNKHDNYLNEASEKEKDSEHHAFLKSQLIKLNNFFDRNPEVIKSLKVDEKKANREKANPVSSKKEPPKAAIQTSLPAKSDSTRIVDNPFVDVSKLPAEFQKKYVEIKSQYKEMSALHASLESMKSDEERQKAIEEIETLDQSIAEKWLEIDTWAKGTEVEKKESKERADQDIESVVKRVENLKKYIRRSNAELEKTTDEERKKKLTDNISAWTSELDAIMKKQEKN